MKKILILIVLCLFITRCETYDDLSKYNGAIIKYKAIDKQAAWVELGIKQGHQSHLIYVPLEYSTLNVNDTIK